MYGVVEVQLARLSAARSEALLDMEKGRHEQTKNGPLGGLDVGCVNSSDCS